MKRNSVIFADHLGTISFTASGVVMEYSYRDCLSEKIVILRLKLYGDELLTLDPKVCKHSAHLVMKIEHIMKELYGLDGQSAA